MLIRVKNPDLYRRWIEYFRRMTDMAPYEARFYAWVQSNEGLPTPM